MRLLAQSLKETTAQLCGLEFTEAQSLAMDALWTRLREHMLQHEDCACSHELSRGILELLFQLFVTFWTEVPGDADLGKTAIANYSGVLGIHPIELSFRRAYSYTPFLSALLWIGRLILLEYAIPLRPYKTLALPWLGRDAYVDLGQRLSGRICPKYLHRGSISPVGYLIERLQHGRAIAKHDGPRTSIS